MTKYVVATLAVSSIIFLTACQPKTNSTAGASPSPASTSETSAESGTPIDEITRNIAAGKSYSCTFVSKQNQQTMDVKVQGNKFALDMTMEVSGQTMNISMISDGEMMYSWDEKSGTGMKMAIPKDKAVNVPGTNGVPNLSDANAWNALQKDYTMDCKPSMVASTEFTPPKNITFTDLSQLMRSAGAAE